MSGNSGVVMSRSRHLSYVIAGDRMCTGELIVEARAMARERSLRKNWCGV